MNAKEREARLAAMREAQPLEELIRKANKAQTRDGTWTQEEIDLARVRARNAVSKITWT